MCLYNIDKKKTEEYQKSTKTIVAYRVIRKCDKRYYPVFNYVQEPLRRGINHASQKYITTDCHYAIDKYLTGFHSFINKKDAFFYKDEYSYRDGVLSVIKVFINPEDVTAYGHQHVFSFYETLVSSKITIKSYRECKK